jgi:hypothetical protein
MAIRHEEKGETGKADGFWSKACKLWGDIGHDRNNFWRSYTVAYNEGRHARDQFKESNVAAVRERVLEGVSAVNVEFARLYLAKGEIGHVKRHVKYAKSVATARTFVENLATTLREEGGRALRDRLPDLADLAEYINSDVVSSKENKTMASNLHFEAALAELWNGQVAPFQKHLSKAGQLMDDASDVFSKPGQTDRAYLDRVVRETKTMLNGINNIDVAKGKMVLLHVVLKMCALWHSVPSYQRSLLEQKMSEFLPQIFLESITSVASAGK